VVKADICLATYVPLIHRNICFERSFNGGAEKRL